MTKRYQRENAKDTRQNAMARNFGAPRHRDPGVPFEQLSERDKAARIREFNLGPPRITPRKGKRTRHAEQFRAPTREALQEYTSRLANGSAMVRVLAGIRYTSGPRFGQQLAAARALVKAQARIRELDALGPAF